MKVETLSNLRSIKSSVYCLPSIDIQRHIEGTHLLLIIEPWVPLSSSLLIFCLPFKFEE